MTESLSHDLENAWMHFVIFLTGETQWKNSFHRK